MTSLRNRSIKEIASRRGENRRGESLKTSSASTDEVLGTFKKWGQYRVEDNPEQTKGFDIKPFHQ